MPALVSILSDDKVFLLTNAGCVTAYPTVQEAIDSFGYKECHARSYESSMSAAMHWMSFHPAVHDWQHEDLQPLVDNDIIILDEFRNHRLSNISGVIQAAICTGKKAKEWHENGIEVKLI